MKFLLQNIFFAFNLHKSFFEEFWTFLTGFSFYAVWPCWSILRQVLSDLKGFRTTLVKKLFRLKMFTLLETRIASKRFSVLFGVF